MIAALLEIGPERLSHRLVAALDKALKSIIPIKVHLYFAHHHALLRQFANMPSIGAGKWQAAKWPASISTSGGFS